MAAADLTRTALALLFARTAPAGCDPHRRYLRDTPTARWRRFTEVFLPVYLPARIAPPWLPWQVQPSATVTCLTRTVIRWAAAFVAVEFGFLPLFVALKAAGLPVNDLADIVLLAMAFCAGGAVVAVRHLFRITTGDLKETPDGRP